MGSVRLHDSTALVKEGEQGAGSEGGNRDGPTFCRRGVLASAAAEVLPSFC